MGNTSPKCYVLDFSCDDNSGCDLIVLVNGVRFFIRVEERTLRQENGEGSELYNEYIRLLQSVRNVRDQEATPAAEESLTKASGSRDSAHGSSPPAEAEEDQRDGTDSAVGLDEQEQIQLAVKDKEKADEAENSPNCQPEPPGNLDDNPHSALQNWILSCFGSSFQEFAPKPEKPPKQSLHEWYHPQTHSFTIEIKDNTLVSVQLEEQQEYRNRVGYLLPRMTLPKYLRDTKIPWKNPKDITVLSENDEPAPLHPTRVQVDQNVHFFKPVDSELAGPMKRELKILTKIEKLGLHKKMHVPQLLGLVASEGSNTDIMGFLLTEIKGARPLTTLLDEDIPAAKRRQWAEESERVVTLLHDHDIVWGDAKADNFLVDQDDKLWIIDFGGSYTEGWVDPDLNETEQGDEMGVEKIVNALEDPPNNTYDPSIPNGYESSDLYTLREAGGGKSKKRRAIDVSELSQKRTKVKI